MILSIALSVVLFLALMPHHAVAQEIAWQKIDYPVNASAIAIDADDHILAAWGPSVYRSTDEGSTWSRVVLSSTYPAVFTA